MTTHRPMINDADVDVDLEPDLDDGPLVLAVNPAGMARPLQRS